MSKQRHRGRKAAANTVRPRTGNAANRRQKSVSKRPSPKGRRTPRYDAEHRELRVGDRIVKCLKQASDAVEIILLAFEEENWSSRIDDPLTGKVNKVQKERLRRAVDNLNRRQLVPLIRFGVALQGTAVTWEFRKQRR